jgi:8-oxo-dGTP pyrophosphatase MutT (NUDIX family)
MLKVSRILMAYETDEEIGSGEHALTTHGQFWGSKGAGCVMYAESTGRLLLALRSPYVNEPNTWGVWGGKLDNNETPEQAAIREVKEEAGFSGKVTLKQAHTFTKGDFTYTTFVAFIPDEFTPHLDWETQSFRWVEPGEWPSPLHFGLQAAIPGILGVISK